MTVGSFMGQVFTVSDIKILTPTNWQGAVGSDWSEHERIGEKPRKQWIGPKARKYTCDILLRAQDGVAPRETLEALEQIAESDKTDHFVIGGKPISSNPFCLTELSEAWNTVLAGGKLVECKVSLTIEEYV